MVVLNNKLSHTEDAQADDQHKKTEQTTRYSHNGIASLATKVPTHTEGSLPLKLVSNTNVQFLYFLRITYEISNKEKFLTIRKNFLNHNAKIHNVFLRHFLQSTRNKDIR